MRKPLLFKQRQADRKIRQSGSRHLGDTASMAELPQLLRAAGQLSQQLRGAPSLRRLAVVAGLSPSHLQREFKRLIGESPSHYLRRLRLLIAAARLLHDDAPLRRIADQTGFGSAEVLIRNFRTRFGCTPAQYRRRHGVRRLDLAFRRGLLRVTAAAPCFSLFRLTHPLPRRTPMPLLTASLRTLTAQHALIIRSRVPRSAIAETIGQSLGQIVPYAMSLGGTFAGQPFARYPESGPGSITIEVGMPLAVPLPGQGDIEAIVLPEGPAAVAVHAGAYESLHETYAALESWIADQGRQTAGAPWEVYVTDPAEHPDVSNWRTEVYWPLA